MISSAHFTWSLLGRCSVARAVNPRRGHPPGAPDGAADRYWGDLMAAAGELSRPPAGSFHGRLRGAFWPPTGSFLAAYGELSGRLRGGSHGRRHSRSHVTSG